MPRPKINRKEIAKKVAEMHGLSSYEVLDFMNYIDKTIKDSMRSNEMPEIFLNGFLRIKPNHVHIIQSLSYKYIKLLSNMVKKENNYTLDQFEKDFDHMMRNYLEKYRIYRESRKSIRRKKYYEDFYNQYK